MRSTTRPESRKRRPSVPHCGPPLLEDPGQRYAVCPMPPYSKLGQGTSSGIVFTVFTLSYYAF